MGALLVFAVLDSERGTRPLLEWYGVRNGSLERERGGDGGYGEDGEEVGNYHRTIDLGFALRTTGPTSKKSSV